MFKSITFAPGEHRLATKNQKPCFPNITRHLKTENPNWKKRPKGIQQMSLKVLD